MRGMTTFVRRAATSATLAVAAVGLTAGSAQAADPEFGFESFTAEAVKIDGTTRTPFTQASGHPDELRIAFRLNAKDVGTDAPQGVPVEEMRDLEIELPAGLQGNPMATSRCSLEVLTTSGTARCPTDSVVGYHTLSYVQGLSPLTFSSRIYNLDPPAGVTARFGFSVATVMVFIDMQVNDDGRYTITSKIRNASAGLAVLGSETVLYGTPALRNGAGTDPGGAGGVGTGKRIPLLTMGSDCAAPQRVSARVRSWQQPSVWKPAAAELPTLTGCDAVPFAASLTMAPETTMAAAPSGFTTTVELPQASAPNAVSPAPLKKVEVGLPVGVAINPSSAQGLVGCTDAQARTRQLGDPSCPDASKIGTVKIETPVLPGALNGFVFLGEPKSQIAANGDMFRVFLVAKGYGVTIKQEGRITPDPATGQLHAVFDEVPQQPFERMTLAFNGGPRAPLTTPTACGEHTTVARLTSTTGRVITSQSRFTTACRDGLLGFSPTFVAGVDNVFAGASSPFRLSVGRADGQRALTGVSLSMPKGLLANLKGNLGQQVGSVRAYAGFGSEPFGLPGAVFLEGPYGDAPFSLRVVVPAVAGPYNLGDVVVRQKLYVDPDTAQVTTVSDPLPTILQGVPVQLQRLDVAIDKAGFMINPTSCEAQQVAATLTSETGQAVPGANRFAVGGCRELQYAPKLDLRLRGNSRELRNGGHPRLDATLSAGKGEANQKQAQVTLPLNLALDPQNAKALCEPSLVATNGCPVDSIVGKAKATSILDVPLEGPVYFVRGERTTSTGRTVATLPKLFIPLSGQGVRINLHASSDVVDDHLQTTFDNLPDAPIESFDLQINGGSNGILKVTNGHVCSSRSTPTVSSRLTGQNGKRHRQSAPLGTNCRFGVVRTVSQGNRVTTTVRGLRGGGRLTVSGAGVETNRRTISARSTVASIGVSANAATRRAVREGRSVRLRLRVAFQPKDGATRTVTRTVTVKPAARR